MPDFFAKLPKTASRQSLYRTFAPEVSTVCLGEEIEVCSLCGESAKI
jgi:hypothetical protein